MHSQVDGGGQADALPGSSCTDFPSLASLRMERGEENSRTKPPPVGEATSLPS